MAAHDGNDTGDVGRRYMEVTKPKYQCLLAHLRTEIGIFGSGWVSGESRRLGGWLVEASGIVIVGSAVEGFITTSLEGGTGVCAHGLVTCGIADDEGVISRGDGDRYEIR
jgi:hypothetical protein